MNSHLAPIFSKSQKIEIYVFQFILASVLLLSFGLVQDLVHAQIRHYHFIGQNLCFLIFIGGYTFQANSF